MAEQTIADYVRYETPAATHRLLGLNCGGYGAFACKKQVCKIRTLDCYAALLVSAGCGWIETAATSGRLSVTAPALIWLFPGVPHSYAPDAEGWTEQWVLFEGATAETSERLGFLSRFRPVQHLDETGEVASLFVRMREDFVAGGPLAGLRAASLVQRLLVVARDAASTEEREQPGAGWDMRPVLARLDACALQSIDFAALAREHNMGYSTLRRRFKEATGYSPKEYVLRIRLSRAKELLTLTSDSVASIAHAVGFEDPYYFSRLFQQKEGRSPTRFRAQQQAGRVPSQGVITGSSRTGSPTSHAVLAVSTNPPREE